MQRLETVEVWNPDSDDAVFIVDSEGTSFETITDDDGEYVGRHLTGESVSFDFHFPTAEVDSERVLETILSESEFEHGGCIMEGQYVVYDRHSHGAFNIGCETDTQIVVHTKQNATAETMRRVYDAIKKVVDVPVRVVNSKRVH